MSHADYAIEAGLYLTGIDYSPIKGPKGNIEFLMLLSSNREKNIEDLENALEDVVNNAHINLDKQS